MDKQKTYRIRHKVRHNALARMWREKNRHKTKAHRLVASAIKSGMLVKPELCDQCNANDSRLHAHHADYSKPLDVVWLCNSCHSKLHGMTECGTKNYASHESHGRAKLKESDVNEIRSMASDGIPKRELARRFLVSEKLIRLICKGEIWK